ncbi:MAG: hypothetical protein mread185_000679 [Mycoplasmataceae bacterium]|nr:MAG: hypothetical protein mread185_000679 [Mycoplasmataceae bacterium]
MNEKISFLLCSGMKIKTTWLEMKQNLGKNAQCQFESRMIGEFVDKKTEESQILWLISSFVLIE